MERNHEYRRREYDGYWLPNKPQGSNIRRHQGNHDSHAFVVRGNSVTTIGNEDLGRLLIAGTVELFRTVSIYFHQTTQQYFGVHFDATRFQVGDGKDNESNSDDDDSEEEVNTPIERLMDWSRIRLNYDTTSGTSTVDFPAHGNQLMMTRNDQQWMPNLFPESYLPPTANRDMVGYSPPSGSINGNLAILVALVAFSATPNGNNVTQRLKDCLRSHGQSWVPPNSHNRKIKATCCLSRNTWTYTLQGEILAVFSLVYMSRMGFEIMPLPLRIA
jgi:hypothetical protein